MYVAPGKRPQFADIFGDNEYSIKKPQRHVEKIREEMVDAYGQKHKRVHERVREHHKPESKSGAGENDFIKKKKAASKASADRRWAKKAPSTVKNSKSKWLG